jgi:hypothetical protein
MGLEHFVHRPRWTRWETSGMFCHGFNAVSHDAHRDGLIIVSLNVHPAFTRSYMHAMNEPMQSPNRKIKIEIMNSV